MKKPAFPEGRVGYESEVPMTESVFNYRQEKMKESIFNYLLVLFGLFLWWYNIDRSKPIHKQKDDINEQNQFRNSY
jgi:hypothetical protein